MRGRRQRSLMLVLILLISPFASVFADDTTYPVVQPDLPCGVYAGSTIRVELTANTGTIYYTLDGSMPSDENYAGFGPSTGTTAELPIGIHKLSYRAVNAKGVWGEWYEDDYKVSGSGDVPGIASQFNEGVQYARRRLFHRAGRCFDYSERRSDHLLYRFIQVNHDAAT
mgnify:CR=1 FL=1